MASPVYVAYGNKSPRISLLAFSPIVTGSQQNRMRTVQFVAGGAQCLWCLSRLAAYHLIDVAQEQRNTRACSSIAANLADALAGVSGVIGGRGNIAHVGWGIAKEKDTEAVR
jgi:hypothetical protein